MICFPNCKINLGLYITGKRPDGYHNIETIFYPVKLRDALEAVPAGHTEINVSGIDVTTDKNNLCLKAYALLKKDFQHLPHISIFLHKVIPPGAGLGGGSADGAFMLKLLNEQFALNLSQEQLLEYALHLGSDCPFFIINKPCIATGRGEILKEIALDLSGHTLVIVNPGIHISTAEAFRKVTPKASTAHLEGIINLPVEQWRDHLTNDFEKSIFEKHPEVEELKKELYTLGALYASMSGSGSTLYGIFNPDDKVHELKHEHYFYKQVIL